LIVAALTAERKHYEQRFRHLERRIGLLALLERGRKNRELIAAAETDADDD
jgi:hypothetical protein